MKTIDLTNSLEGDRWATILMAGFKESKVRDGSWNLMLRLEVQTDLGATHLTAFVHSSLVGVLCDMVGRDYRKIKFCTKTGEIKDNSPVGEKLKVNVKKVFEPILGRYVHEVNWLHPTLRRV